MHYKLMFPSNYVGAHDLKGKDATLAIDSVSVAELTMEGGKKENKPVVTFKGAKKKLVLNKTNAKTIAALYGTDTNAWIGQPVTLYPTTCRGERGATVDCIRVRETKPKGNAPKPAIDDEEAAATDPNAPSVLDLLVEAVAEHNECATGFAYTALCNYCQTLSIDIDHLSQTDAARLRESIAAGEVTV
jgi:hypothetical protein